MKSYTTVLALALVLVAGCGQVDASAVADQATRMESAAAEAALLARGASEGRYTTAFVVARAGELAEDSAGVRDSLREEDVASPARERARRLREVAGQVESAMHQLSERPADRLLAQRLADELGAAAPSLRAG